ncbi:MAG: phosphoglucosamine mutase, partial [Phycisphaerae bacterium]
SYPAYEMTKRKVDLRPDLDVDALLIKVGEAFSGEQLDRTDGLKIDFEQGWVHLRKSNTEPIIRIYSEGPTAEIAGELSDRVLGKIQQYG